MTGHGVLQGDPNIAILESDHPYTAKEHVMSKLDKAQDRALELIGGVVMLSGLAAAVVQWRRRPAAVAAPPPYDES